MAYSTASKDRHVPHRWIASAFSSRWILAPIYAGLIAGLIALLVKFAQKTFELVLHIGGTSGDDAIVGLLGIVDLALMAGLVVMVMFAGYENFVSKLDLEGHPDLPGWMGRVDFGDLKLKLMASIVAISAIHVLESFMNIEHLSDRELGWSVGIHMSVRRFGRAARCDGQAEWREAWLNSSGTGFGGTGRVGWSATTSIRSTTPFRAFCPLHRCQFGRIRLDAGGCQARDAGVVDEHGQATEGIDALLDHAFDI